MALQVTVLGNLLLQAHQIVKVQFHLVQQAFEISVALGMEDKNGIDLSYRAYPNPTVDVLHLTITNFNQENLSYQLYNIQGQLLATKQLSSATTTIGMESYATATYFLKVISNQKELKSFKIIKNH